MLKDSQKDNSLYLVFFLLLFIVSCCFSFYFLTNDAFAKKASEIANNGIEKQINIICSGGKPYIHKDGKYLQLIGWSGKSQTRAFACDYLEPLCTK